MEKQIPAPRPPVAPPQKRRAHSKQKPRRRQRRTRKLRVFGVRVPGWMLFGGIAVFLVSACAAVGLVGVMAMSAGRVSPGVSVMGASVGLLSEADAAAVVREAAGAVQLRDGSHTWTVNAAELGIMVDAEATASRAASVGLAGLFGPVRVEPVASMNSATTADALAALRSQLEIAPRNAGVALVNGEVRPTEARYGRSLDINATVAALEGRVSAALADGEIDLVMRDVAPEVTDAAPLVETARGLLASPLRVGAYDPFDDETVAWNLPPSQWGAWLTAQPDASSAVGLRLTLSENDLSNFLTERADATLPDYQYIEVDEAVNVVNDALARLSTTVTVRVYERDRTHTVRSGETITSIAWDYGIPYPYIQAANPNADTLSAGQSLTIPSREVFLEREPVPGKRIIVSISGNWTKVYEDGELKWDWVSSTGINSSPTWPGLYQIVSHEENAYAGNWNLYMPWFMGVYKPIPGSGFTNGFHGFPTRGGGQLLWENALGTKVTYGCILLSNTNVQLLYDWAEDGVVVEILP